MAASSSVIELDRKPNGMIGTVQSGIAQPVSQTLKNKEKFKSNNESTSIDDDTDDELEMMKHGSSQKDSEDSTKDLSFTLPKPLNLKHAKVGTRLT